MSSDPFRVTFIGDSRTFHGSEGRLPIHDERLYQNVFAHSLSKHLGRPVELTLQARAGWTTRDVWLLVTKDTWVNEQLLPNSDLVVTSAHTADTLPVSVPTYLKDGIRYIAHPGRRQRVRKMYHRTHRGIVRLTRGRIRTTPERVTQELWPRIINMIRLYSDNAPVISTSVSPFNGYHHGNLDPHSKRTSELLLDLAKTAGVPMLDLQKICTDRVHLYPEDGLHWDYETQRMIGEQLAELAMVAIEDTNRPSWVLPGTLPGELPSADTPSA